MKTIDLKRYIENNIHRFTNFAALFQLLRILGIEYKNINFKIHYSISSMVSPINEIVFEENNSVTIWINNNEITEFMQNFTEYQQLEYFFEVLFSKLIKESLLFLCPEYDEYLIDNYREGLFFIDRSEGILNSYAYIEYLIGKILSSYIFELSYNYIDILQQQNMLRAGEGLLSSDSIIGNISKISKKFFIIKIFSDVIFDQNEIKNIIDQITINFINEYVYRLPEVNISVFQILTDSKLYSSIPSYLYHYKVLAQRNIKIFQASYTTFNQKIYYSILDD